MVDPLKRLLEQRQGAASSSPGSATAGGSLGQVLAGVLTRQRDLYQQIGTLARQQSQYVATGESEQLVTVLAARARLIEQVVPLDRQLQPYKGRWQEVLDGMPAADRARVGPLLKEVQQLLAEILRQDEADKESLVRQKEQVQVEIHRTVTGTALNKAYGVRPRVNPGLGQG